MKQSVGEEEEIRFLNYCAFFWSIGLVKEHVQGYYSKRETNFYS